SHSPVYPVLVVGPGIVTGQENWPKEIVEVTPGATSRVIQIAARPLPKPAKIGEWLKRLGVQLEEVTFEGQTPEQSLRLITKTARKQKVPLSDLQHQALQEALERAAKDPPARRKGAKAPNLLDGRVGGYGW